MKWLQQIIEKVCKNTQIVNQNGSIRVDNYSISVIDDNNLFSIRVVDLINGTPPKITKTLFYDEVEDHLIETIKSL